MLHARHCFCPISGKATGPLYCHGFICHVHRYASGTESLIIHSLTDCIRWPPSTHLASSGYYLYKHRGFLSSRGFLPRLDSLIHSLLTHMPHYCACDIHLSLHRYHTFHTHFRAVYQISRVQAVTYALLKPKSRYSGFSLISPP